MQRINKPRVFLSHSKQDAAFIERIYNDLRKCQIEPWLDTEEIRHGKPWLDAIFEDGIPTCDCVLLYFTENSIESKMVKKEMDTAIIHQLKEGGVAFLPYVVNESIRLKLRADIQALQAPIWMDENYKELLPTVVSEIWRSYLERTISTAIQSEKVKRLQAELELEKNKQLTQSKIFSDAEDADFTYIWDSLNRFVEIDVVESRIENAKTDDNGDVIVIGSLYGDDKKVAIKSHVLKIHLGKLVALLTETDKNMFIYNYISHYIDTEIISMKHLEAIKESPDHTLTTNLGGLPKIIDDLLMYGLVDTLHIPSKSNFNNSTTYTYGNKIQRFRYWLSYNGLLPKSIEIIP